MVPVRLCRCAVRRLTRYDSRQEGPVATTTIHPVPIAKSWGVQDLPEHHMDGIEITSAKATLKTVILLGKATHLVAQSTITPDQDVARHRLPKHLDL